MLTIALTGRMPHAALETETTGHLDVLRDADVDARVIQDEIKQKLGEELLFGALEHGGHVDVDEKDDALTFVFTAKTDEKGDATSEKKAAVEPSMA